MPATHPMALPLYANPNEMTAIHSAEATKPKVSMKPPLLAVGAGTVIYTNSQVSTFNFVSHKHGQRTV